MKRLTLSIDDVSRDIPDGIGWKLYSFGRRHAGYEHPSKFFPEDSDNDPTPYHKEVSDKLASGLAFVCSYFEHGNCVWSLEGSGPQCQWDNVPKAGILIFEEGENDMGAKTYDDRAKDAANFLEIYTAWCNGNIYGYNLEDVTECDHCGHEILKDVDSCWGFYGVDSDLDNMAEHVRSALNGDTDVEVVGDASWLADHHNFIGKKAA